MAEKDFISWHLLALFFLPFCLCQDEYMEVSRRSYKPVAKILQSHHQTGHKGSRSREILKQRNQLIEWTVDNSTSTDHKVLRPEVDDVELTTSDRVQHHWFQLDRTYVCLIGGAAVFWWCHEMNFLYPLRNLDRRIQTAVPAAEVTLEFDSTKGPQDLLGPLGCQKKSIHKKSVYFDLDIDMEIEDPRECCLHVDVSLLHQLPSGNHGNNGNNGATGQEGAKGEKGDKGDIGPRGERGHHGPKGEKGYPGIPPELQVAFMASMATHFSNQNSGIIFSSVETNVGNFFDVMTGRFGAPVNGVYFFTFNMMKHEDVEEVYVYLMHNGNTVFSLYSYESKGKADTSGNSAVLKLAKGDEVWLRMGNGALHGDHQRFSTFAGFLLFETK
ncbi:hypothetical protein DV515_00011025 [Chloebia gouldiae]|uniref:C1q domain-containing protein n=1 Tax=Chloebia gouldiae TaxID=44316 RepID=A0A3L8S7C9_CHLGU|nr:hypothetical protein DV515_00011025 [Chloebia gouldiae]